MTLNSIDEEKKRNVWWSVYQEVTVKLTPTIGIPQDLVPGSTTLTTTGQSLKHLNLNSTFPITPVLENIWSPRTLINFPWTI